MNLPNPLVPREADLRDFQYMPLDVSRLRDSDFTIQSSAEAFRTGVMLWCAAWHQIPAGSIPDDDSKILHLAGYGRIPPRGWKKIKEEALHGWILCNDGRFYHPVVCEKVLESMEAKLKHAYEKFTDRMRKANKKRTDSNQPIVEIPDYDTWKASGFPSDWPINSARIPAESGRNKEGIPSNSALKGTEGNIREHKGTEIKSITPPMGDENQETAKAVDNSPPYPGIASSSDEGSPTSWTALGIDQPPQTWIDAVKADWPTLHDDDIKSKWIAFKSTFASRGDLKTPKEWGLRWVAWMANDAPKLIAAREKKPSRQSKSEDDDVIVTRAEVEKHAQVGESYEEAKARLVSEKQARRREHSA